MKGCLVLNISKYKIKKLFMDNVKVLIVDDNAEFLAMLAEFLSNNNYNVVACDSGSEALTKFNEFIPDIVLTDIVMPGFDGIELLLKLRTINPEVRVIVMSGGNRGHADTYLHMADKLGANAVLNKPFELTELLKQVKKIETIS